MSGVGPIKRIVVGVDGSEEAAHALEWAISLARALQSEIVAVFAIAPSIYSFDVAGYAPVGMPPELDEKWRAEMKAEFEQQWCRPLAESGLPYRAVMVDGRPASVLGAVADNEDADLVVVGRRGRGGVAELVLGSVSHELTHHSRRPVLLISKGR